ncbi:MAG: S-layer homology domain-containing protein [Myxococcales bacterium]|nr:S-layer homology domain-containing protein [Myxococcales bacterium]
MGPEWTPDRLRKSRARAGVQPARLLIFWTPMPKPLPSLALALGLSTASASAGATPTDGLLDPCTPATVSGAESATFKDLPPGSAGAVEAEALYAAGVTQGCQANPLLFCPTCELSRAALVTLVVRAAKLPLVSPAQPTFSDVPTTHPFFKEIETAADSGISLGCSAGMFCPEAPATRAHAAVFVAKAAGFALLAPATPSFTDVPASHIAYGHVEALKANCVTAGCSPTEFCPDSEILRAQAAVFIAKAFNLGDTNPCLGASDAGSDAGAGGSDAGAGGGGSGGQWGDSGIAPIDGGGGSGGAGAETEEESGCGCSTPGRRAGGSAALAFALALALGRRRRAL